MKKKICAILLLCVCLLVLLSACGKEKKTGEYQVFYLNADVTRIIPGLQGSDSAVLPG